ncbi:FtsX-like permease family protein [Streptomyces sp. NPDC088194]|uniref:FtsX-like permease family protein n=1 Tax=Streptomyces sp. NPDC088194 TaxID=3154931 RepID=UPI00344BFDE8
MSAVWRAARAAVRRRRLQTVIIGLVVMCSTLTTVLALVVLDAASGPFDRAFARQRGAHEVASFDPAKVSDPQLAATAGRSGVRAAAGPFEQAVLRIPKDWLWMPPGAITVVGRADPGGPVDDIKLLSGHWATGPGQIVVNYSGNGAPGPHWLGTRLTVPGRPTLTVVGLAVSMSRSADSWVAPSQIAALHPVARQMLYRFTSSPFSQSRSRAHLAQATAGLPAGALTGSQSAASLRRTFSAQADSYSFFMTLFGVLGLLVSVLIVGNVVSGAVVSGNRHIGVLKALGFTPNQVVAVYLVMVSLPAVIGAAVGTLAGRALARPILRVAFSGVLTGTANLRVDLWPVLLGLLGVPLIAVVAALVPALRAHRLSAARAISAGSAPRTGRGLRVQRALGGTRLPRSVSLGLGLPFARPGRSLMTMAAILLGVTTVTLATGLTSTMTRLGHPSDNYGGRRVDIEVGGPGQHSLSGAGTKLADLQVEQRLGSLPGAKWVAVRALGRARVAGDTSASFVNFYRGAVGGSTDEIVKGRRPSGPGEIAAGPVFLDRHGLSVGDRTSLDADGRTVPVRIVGELLEGNSNSVDADWATMAVLAPGTRAMQYTVGLAPDADGAAYVSAAKRIDPQLRPTLSRQSAGAPVITVVGFSTIFTVLLSAVTALGVFNTVLLTTRERRRDLGMLKSIGMTPRQVVVMTVTSVAGLGLVGGLLGIPLGILAHRTVLDHVPMIAFPASMRDVWHAPQLAGLALAGVVIAALGALVPARQAARLTISQVLHSE